MYPGGGLLTQTGQTLLRVSQEVVAELQASSREGAREPGMLAVCRLPFPHSPCGPIRSTAITFSSCLSQVILNKAQQNRKRPHVGYEDALREKAKMEAK